MNGAEAGLLVGTSILLAVAFATLLAFVIHDFVKDKDPVGVIIITVVFGLPSIGALIGWLFL